MADNQAPSPPQADFAVVDMQTGKLTSYGLQMIDQLWRQGAAGFVIVPCDATMDSDVITLVPRLHEEGARSYGTGMAYQFTAPSASTGAVTAFVKSGTKSLDVHKVSIDGGLTQAAAGDVAAGKLYLAVFDESLDGGNGVFVLK